jgi:glycosyltransferase involved in cell wall biosynthesis
VTACGWAPSLLNPREALDVRNSIRQKLGIAPDSIVFGIAGALNWNPRRKYTYGLELVQAMKMSSRKDISVLIVGGGSGLEKLQKIAGNDCGKSIFFTGHVPGDEVANYLSAMDIASLPQSRDGVGSFRYTTKISEYAAAGLPIVTGRLPLAYDLDDGSFWRLPGKTPWSAEFISAMSCLMNNISPEQLVARRSRVQSARSEFNSAQQAVRVTNFIRDILEEIPTAQCTGFGATTDAAAVMNPATESGSAA